MWLLTAVMAAAGAVSALAIVHRRPEGVALSLPWLVVAFGAAVADLLSVEMHSGDQATLVEMAGVPLALGMAYTTGAGILAASVLAIVTTWLIRRYPWNRALYNVVHQAASVALAYLAVRIILGSRSPVHLRGVFAISLGVVILELCGTVGVLLATSVSLGYLDRRTLRTVLKEMSVALPFNVVLSVVAVSLAYEEAWSLVILLGAAGLFGLWNRAANAIRKRYANLQLMYDFTVKLAGLSDSDSIVTTALSETRSLLSCKQAQLVIPLGNGAYRCELTGGTVPAQGLGFLSSVEQAVMSTGQPVLMPKGHTELLCSGGFDDVIAAPVPLGEVGTGVLLAANHNSDAETFDAEDLKLFETLAAHLSTALTSSQRLDQLRIEMAAREHQALHDGLTGLANRTLFAQKVCTALEDRNRNEMVGVMLMDLDGFKDINDSLGHHAGDTILKEIAARVEMECGPNQLAARLGGDEFAFVCPSLHSEDEAKALAWAILEVASKPISVDGMVLELRASVGLALAPHHGVDASSLLQKADMAMYEAKGSKRGVVAYNVDMDRSTKRRLTLATGLRRAFDLEQLEVWFQPVARSDNGRVTGCEALLRWRTDLEFVSPAEFIPVAEQTGLIEPLTWWVLETSLREVKQWQEEDLGSSVAVNLSARCLQSPEIVGRIQQLLDEVEVDPRSLTLEITESLLLSDPDASERILAQLNDLGVRIAIDDFGTGYSSMSRLKRLPVDSLKVDREFVMNMHADESDEAIVRATLQLAQALGLEVTAEGVESFETWHRLRALGCDQIQGYLLAAAMPPEECRRWLRARRQLDSGAQYAFGRVVGGA